MFWGDVGTGCSEGGIEGGSTAKVGKDLSDKADGEVGTQSASPSPEMRPERCERRLLAAHRAIWGQVSTVQEMLWHSSKVRVSEMLPG